MKGFESRWGGFLESLHCPCKPGFIRWVVLCLAYLALTDTPAGLMAANPELDYVAICAIQGNGDISPIAGQNVRTAGVVYADFESLSGRGFYLQQEDCDSDSTTSDGLFVYLADGSDNVSSGDYAEISGTVLEYHGQTEIQTTSSGIVVLSGGHALPSPVDLDIPMEDQTVAGYIESLEGMHVRMAQARVTGPTDDTDQTWVVNANLGVDRIYAGESVGAIVCVDDQGLYEILPEAKVTDILYGLQGALEVTEGISRLHLLAQPAQYSGDLSPEAGVQPVSQGFTVASFNLSNLFDGFDDPLTDDSVLPAAELQRRLQKRALTIHEILAEPDILILQEAENIVLLQALVNRPEIEANYGIVWENGPDPRGLDIAVMYRQDRVSLIGYQVWQGCTGLIDGLGPDGNGDVESPANDLTCDLNGDGDLDGNRLFSRPPLVVKLRVVNGNSQVTGNLQTIDLTVIANHWKSRIEDTKEIQYTLMRREQQAQFVASLVESEYRRAESDYIIVAGDLNDVPISESINILKTIGLRDMTQDIERSGRYSMIYRGVSQVLDYVLELPSIQHGAAQVKMLHINADFPAVFETVDGTVYRSSDHDPIWVNIIQFSRFVFFPQLYLAE